MRRTKPRATVALGVAMILLVAACGQARPEAGLGAETGISTSTQPHPEDSTEDESPGPMYPEPVLRPLSPGEEQFLLGLAEEHGISLEEAIARFGWQDDFGEAMTRIADGFPLAFAFAEIVDDFSAAVTFTANAPSGALGVISSFEKAFPEVSVQVREDYGLTRRELEKLVPEAHYAVYERSEIREASTSFDEVTKTLTTLIILEDGVPESFVQELYDMVATRLGDAGMGEIRDRVEFAIIIARVPTLGWDFPERGDLPEG